MHRLPLKFWTNMYTNAISKYFFIHLSMEISKITARTKTQDLGFVYLSFFNSKLLKDRLYYPSSVKKHPKASYLEKNIQFKL